MKKETINDISRKLEIAKAEMIQEMKTRLNVNKLMNKLVFGSSNGSYHNCPPGYDNEGNSTPNQNF